MPAATGHMGHLLPPGVMPASPSSSGHPLLVKMPQLSACPGHLKYNTIQLFQHWSTQKSTLYPIYIFFIVTFVIKSIKSVICTSMCTLPALQCSIYTNLKQKKLWKIIIGNPRPRICEYLYLLKRGLKAIKKLWLFIPFNSHNGFIPIIQTSLHIFTSP